MSEKTSTDDTDKLLNQAISAFVSITHVIAFFQIVICSRHMAVAFDIPAKNIGIYFAKLYSLRSLLMSAGCAIEYIIYRASGAQGKEVRRYSSIAWFVLLTICEVCFLLVLYLSKRVAFHNYIVLNLEGLFFGFFQMSILSLIPEFAAYYMLSLYVSGTCIFIIQTIIDRCTKNSMLSVKTQSWICVVCSVISFGLWTYYLIEIYKDPVQSQTSSQTTETSNGQSSTTSTGPCRRARSLGSRCSTSEPMYQTNGSTMEYLMTMSSISILKIMTDKLNELCSQLSSEAIANVQILIRRLEQITREQDISYDVLVAIDLVILGLKKCTCPEDKLCLLAELSLFLRIKVLIKPLEEQGQQVPIEEFTYEYSTSGIRKGEKCSSGEPVVLASGRYMGLIKSQSQNGRTIREEHSETPVARPGRTRRSSTNETPSQCSSDQSSILYSISPLLMFPIGSLVKDFLFPGVIPYGLLERDKCHLINLIVIIFLSVGPVTIFIMNIAIQCFKSDHIYYHGFWGCMVPKILIFIISLCAIHTKRGPTHKIRSSQGIVLFMTVVLLTCYGFLETMSFVGVAYFAKIICKGHSISTDLQAIHNVSGKFFRYFVYKLSVGYNKTRIGAGFVLPNFKPPEPIPDDFCYWFKGAFSNGWKDIKGDFKMGIQQYLAASQTVSKKSPLETLRYCDLLM